MTPRDETRRRERLEQQANRLDLVSRWADDLAHEIKNPLHAMVINLELVKRRAGRADPTSLVERAEVVETELHRVHALVDSLLRLVRPWPDSGTAAVHEVFEALLPVFAARARIRQVEYRHEPGSGIVVMAPGDLAQLLVNLVDNAIEATPDGGRVVTTVEEEEDGLRITVSDTGRGLPAGTLDELSVRARDAHAGADEDAGLGLAISHRLVDRAGGSIRLASDADGTRAVVTIPRTGVA